MNGASHFDAVIVGSGFGGSVVAYRLAAAGFSVCVLERGKAYPPGAFARRPREMAANFWDPSRGHHGLFNIWSFRGIEAVVSSGLGGGSLIYANVLLRKDERWFVHESPFDGGFETWPISRAELDPHYDEVEKMMGAQSFPFAAPGYDIPKTRAMKDAAEALNLNWQLPKLAVTFGADGGDPIPGELIPQGPFPNMFGRARVTCRLCGECDIGCNYGSKNTLDHTYLSAAKHHGADIRTRCEVRRFEPRADGGFSVGYVEHMPEQEGNKTRTNKLPIRDLTCDRLVLAAGTLGSTYLLLRNRSAFPGIGPALGTRFCGNGDLLSFMLRSRSKIGKHRVLDGSRGPVITSAIRVPDEADEDGDGRGYYVEDAGYPLFVDWMLEGTTVGNTAVRFLKFAFHRLRARISNDPRSDLGAEMAALIGSAELSSGSLPLLGMGRDVPDGVMELRDGHLDVKWTIKTSQAYFDRVGSTMADMSKALGASFRKNPLGRLRRVITVHPLGGCPMADRKDKGVVNPYGEVFEYPGMYITDGAVMPGPVGANPSLTIAAFADRAAQRIVEEGRGARRTQP